MLKTARRVSRLSRALGDSEQLRTEAACLYGEGPTLSQVAEWLEIGDEAIRSVVVVNVGTIRPCKH